MFREPIILLVAFALATFTTMADAANLRMRPGSSGGSSPANGPILNNVTVSYGQYTANGMGGVRLSSMDDATSYGVPVYGLGLQSPSGTPCTNWMTTQTSGTSTHFSKYTGAEGTTARTPVITSIGDSANLNAGPYIFNVSCTDSNGTASNTATLTYTIVDNAATVDEYTGNFPAVTSGFANFATTAGYKLLVPTGFKKLTGAGWSITCPTECTMEWADKANPGLFQSFIPHSGQNTHLEIKDMIFTGDATAHPLTFGTSTLGTNTLRLTNVGCRFKPQVAMASPLVCLNTRWNGAPGDSITDFSADWIGLGMRISGDGYTIKRATVSNFGTNAMDVDNTEDLIMEDVLFYNPQVTVGGYHADCWQISNGASIKNWNIKRFGCLTAGGFGAAQGPIFPGHTTVGKGYISDGAGGAGFNVVLTAPVADPNAFFTPSVVGSQLYAPGCIGPSENARVSASNLFNTATLTGISSRLCGSAVSPIDIATYTFENVNFQGMVHTGYSSWGMATHENHGTGGMQNFAYVGHVPQTLYTTNVTVNIVGNQLTTIGPTYSNAFYNAGLTAGSVGIGYYVGYPGLVGAGLRLTAKSAGSNYCIGDNGGCVYTLDRAPGDVSGVTISAVPPVGSTAPVNTLVQVLQMDADLDWLYTGGATTYKDGWSSAGMVWPKAGNAGYQSFPPINTTVTNVWGTNSAPGAIAFSNGDPKANLEAVPQATWDAMTAAEVLAMHCHFMLPKVGGPLDNGDGTFASPFKPVGGAGQWWDGTPIPGCS